MWSQTWHHIVVYICVPNDTKKKNVSVQLKPTSLRIEGVIALNFELDQAVYPSDSTWTFDEVRTNDEKCRRVLCIHLRKVDISLWWWRLSKSQEEIYDEFTRPAESNNLSEVSEETRMTFQKSYECQKNVAKQRNAR